MDLQAYMPTFVFDLVVALGLAIVLIGLLWMVGRLMATLGARLWRVLRILLTIMLQALLFVGAVLVMLRFMDDLDVIWLVVLFTLMFGIGARLSRRGGADQTRPDRSKNLPAQSAAQVTVPAKKQMPPAGAPTIAANLVILPEPAPDNKLSPDLSGDVALSSAVGAVPGSVPATTTAPDADAAVDVALPDTADPNVQPDSVLLGSGQHDAESDLVLPNTTEQPAARIQRPWQRYMPASLTRRHILGTKTIRVLRTTK